VLGALYAQLQAGRQCRDGKHAVNEERRDIRPRYKVVCLPDAAAALRGDPGDVARCYHDAGSLRNPASVATAALFHFTTKSQQDFDAKLSRGSAMTHRGKNWSFFERVARCARGASSG